MLASKMLAIGKQVLFSSHRAIYKLAACGAHFVLRSLGFEYQQLSALSILVALLALWSQWVPAGPGDISCH